MEFPAVNLQKSHSSKTPRVVLLSRVIFILLTLAAVLLLYGKVNRKENRATIAVMSKGGQNFDTVAPQRAAMRLVGHFKTEMKQKGFQQLWDNSPDRDADDDSEMSVHWHKRPYAPRNRVSVDQEGDWKVRWSRDDDPEAAGRMDDARWNLLSKLGTSEHSPRHDDVPAVPYYERIAELEKEAYREEGEDNARTADSDSPSNEIE